jgi:ribosomal protein S18 acetylase RimI-like enzyme
VIFRLSQPKDFSQLYAIETECFPPSVRFPKSYMRKLLANRRAAVWVAVEDVGPAAGELAGFAIVDWRRGVGEALAYIETLEVAPKFRRQGIGRELLLRVIWSASNAGASSLWLHVAEENEAAQGLYQTHEFITQGREEDYYTLGNHAVMYARTLVPCRVARTC